MKQLDLLADYLRQNHSQTVSLQVLGNSMRPYLVHERDSVLLHYADNVRVGDVVLAEIKPSHYVLHRVVKLTESGEMTMRGDGNRTTEQCRREDVRGVVVGFIRGENKKTSTTADLSYRLYAWFWMHTLPLRGVMLRLHNICFGSCKDLSKYRKK